MTGPKKRGKPEARAPGWMLTMGDMNTLLLTFFVILVSMLAWEKPSKAAARVSNVGLENTQLAQGDELLQDRGQVVRKLRDVVQEISAEPTEFVIDGHYVHVSLEGPSSYVVAIGGQYGAFREGDFRMMDWAEKALDIIREAFSPHGYVLVIRGHTSGWKRDSVVRLDDGSWVPFHEAEAGARARRAAAPEDGDHIELAFLRAQEAFRYLTTEDPETHLRIARNRIRLEALGDRETVADEVGYAFAGYRKEEPREDFGGPNRRVEVVVRTQEMRTGE